MHENRCQIVEKYAVKRFEYLDKSQNGHRQQDPKRGEEEVVQENASRCTESGVDQVVVQRPEDDVESVEDYLIQ